jgi:hypothetical protein
MLRLIKYPEIFTFFCENGNVVVLGYGNTASITLCSLWLYIVLILTVFNRKQSSAVANFHKNAYFEEILETCILYFSILSAVIELRIVFSMLDTYVGRLPCC